MSTPQPHRVTPFWQRLPQITAYPLQGGALSMIALLSALRLIDLLPFGGILVLVPHFLISLGLYRYAVQVFYDTSEGRLEPPEYSFGVDNREAFAQIKLQVILILAMFAAFAFGSIRIGLAVTLLLAIATPAATMSLAMEGSLLHALNPINWVRIAAGFGAPYLLLAALCLFYGLAQTVAVAFLPEWLPQLISIPFFWFISHYTVVVSFHAMGYLIYQHREKAGYRSVEPERLPERRHNIDADQPLIDEVTALAKNNAPEAIKQLRVHLDSRGGTQLSHDTYRKMLTAENDQAELARHARQYVSVLMAQSAGVKAVTLLQACLDSDPGYSPSDVAELRPMAEHASKFGKHDLAVRVLVNGMKQFPKSRENPANALLAARLLSEKLSNDVQARTLLAAIRERFPEHPLTGDMDRYLQQLGNLQAG
jgi:hypothetical protein